MRLDLVERQDLKAFLLKVYGPQVNSWPMNDRIFDLTYTMVSESSKCSDLMDLVPRPIAVGQSPIRYLTKQARALILRRLKQREQHYAVCVSTAALRMKIKFQMATSGI